jgi:hypothetical protein
LPGLLAPIMPLAPPPAPVPNPMVQGRFAPMPSAPAPIKFQNIFLPPPASSGRVPTTQNVETGMPTGAQFTGTHVGPPVGAAQPVSMWPMTVPPIPVLVPAPDDQQKGWPMTVPPVPVPAPDDQQKDFSSNTNINGEN